MTHSRRSAERLKEKSVGLGSSVTYVRSLCTGTGANRLWLLTFDASCATVGGLLDFVSNSLQSTIAAWWAFSVGETGIPPRSTWRIPALYRLKPQRLGTYYRMHRSGKLLEVLRISFLYPTGRVAFFPRRRASML